jgi:hypothetical protein
MSASLLASLILSQDDNNLSENTPGVFLSKEKSFDRPLSDIAVDK